MKIKKQIKRLETVEAEISLPYCFKYRFGQIEHAVLVYAIGKNKPVFDRVKCDTNEYVDGYPEYDATWRQNFDAFYPNGIPADAEEISLNEFATLQSNFVANIESTQRFIELWEGKEMIEKATEENAAPEVKIVPAGHIKPKVTSIYEPEPQQ